MVRGYFPVKQFCGIFPFLKKKFWSKRRFKISAVSMTPLKSFRRGQWTRWNRGIVKSWNATWYSIRTCSMLYWCSSLQIAFLPKNFTIHVTNELALPNAWRRSVRGLSWWYHNHGSETMVQFVEYLYRYVNWILRSRPQNSTASRWSKDTASGTARPYQTYMKWWKHTNTYRFYILIIFKRQYSTTLLII
jgi:hypothetical protein